MMRAFSLLAEFIAALTLVAGSAVLIGFASLL